MKKQRRRWRKKTEAKAKRQDAAIQRARKHAVVQPIIAEIMVPRFGKPLTVSPPMLSLAERLKRENDEKVAAVLKAAGFPVGQRGLQDFGARALLPLATPLYDTEFIPVQGARELEFFTQPNPAGRRSGGTPNIQNIAPRPPRRR